MQYFIYLLMALTVLISAEHENGCGLPCYFWQDPKVSNFGDNLSLPLIERIVGEKIVVCKGAKGNDKKLLGLGSLLYFARDGDVLWGTGCNYKQKKKEDYSFKNLDIRAVRGPLTRRFLIDNFGIEVPEIYGDPALLIPYFFPEFQRKEHPRYEYIVIPHYSEIHLFPKDVFENVVYPTEPWQEVIEKILDSKFVIASALHGVVVAEAFGIPARCLRVTENEPLFKYQDYYLGTNRPNFQYATSIEEAIKLGGEAPVECNLERLYKAFPFEFWKKSDIKPSFSKQKLSRDLDAVSSDFVLETKRIEFAEYPGAFNPTIIRYKDKILMSFRIRDILTGETNKMGLVWLNDQLDPISDVQEIFITTNYGASPSKAQDARLIEVDHKLYIVYNDMVNLYEPPIRRMFVAELVFDGEVFQVMESEPILEFEGSSPRMNEKNWVPFEYQKELFLSYSIAPHKVMKPLFDGHMCQNYDLTHPVIRWDWGVLRGGTPALKMGDEYLAFFHSCKSICSEQSEGKKIPHYFMGAYTFKGDPPFHITKMSPGPILAERFYSGQSYVTWKPLLVVFPCGYIFNETCIWISYGRQDNEIWVVKLDKQKLFDSLVHVNHVE